MATKLVLYTEREGYAISQIDHTMTAGEIVELLQEYDEDTPVYLAFDNGYTYGSVHMGRFEEKYDDEDDEYEDEAEEA